MTSKRLVWPRKRNVTCFQASEPMVEVQASTITRKSTRENPRVRPMATILRWRHLTLLLWIFLPSFFHAVVSGSSSSSLVETLVNARRNMTNLLRRSSTGDSLEKAAPEEDRKLLDLVRFQTEVTSVVENIIAKPAHSLDDDRLFRPPL